jgi:hypothetical protein
MLVVSILFLIIHTNNEKVIHVLQGQVPELQRRELQIAHDLSTCGAPLVLGRVDRRVAFVIE